MDESKVPPDQELVLDDGLTPIHRRIHCAATPNTVNGENELDHITIDCFLETLAEVAIAIARRRQTLDL